MATYVNNLRLKEIATGDESGTWGTSTNTNLELIGEGLGYGTEQVAADSNETFTMADGVADGMRGMYLKFTSAGTLTATRTLTLAPNTVSKVWIIENATSGSQIITIKQGSGGTVDIANGDRAMVYTDGAGAGGAVLTANPSESGVGTVTSVATSGTVNGITLTGGPITSSGTITLGGTLGSVDLTSQITGTLPIANGGTNSTSTTYCDLTANVSGVLPFANGGSGAITPLRKGVGYTAVNRDYIIVTAGSITITLPTSPSAGDTVTIKDGTGAAATTSFTVGRAGSNIASSATDLTFDKNWAEVVMTYIDGTIGWSV
tara:strand:+ start:525 stop:1478 length:954 start_codon:yes stop_codon:yes gene_type:complete